MNFNNHQLLDITLNLFCRRTHTYKNGTSPIALRITYRGERREILTGHSCEKNKWRPQEQQVSSASRLSGPVNQELQKIIFIVRQRFEELKYSKISFTIDELIDKIKGKEAPPQTIIEYLELKIEELKYRIGIDLAKTTFFKYDRTYRYIAEFLEAKKGVKNIAVAKIDGELLSQFFMFLRKNKTQQHNSAVALMNCLKTILRTPVKNGTIARNPFDEYPLTQKPVFRDFLELDEIKKLQQLQNLNKEQEFKRDLFLLACFTGMAYSDIKQLTSRDIVTDPDGSIAIRYNRQKTGVLGIIPLLPVAQNILLKYSLTCDCRDFKWQVMSNQKLNSGLKEIARKAGIEKPLFMHLGRHTFATTVTLTHGVPLETVSKMLGHSTIKHTQIYAKIVASKVKVDMSKIQHLFT
ncbi:site-specific integrase [soil metagenome]